MGTLTGRVISIQFLGGFAIASKQAPVLGLHWEERLAARLLDEGGSRRPAVYRIESQIQAEVVVSLTVTGSVGEAATLQGELDGMMLQGDLTLGNGSVTVVVTGTLDNAIVRHAGDVVWSIASASLSSPVVLTNTTFLEVFAILGPPVSFFKDGVWVEALRLLTLRAGLAGVRDPQEAVALITQHCHHDHGLTYDAEFAQNHFNVEKSGGRFHLRKFIESPNLVSCFDLLAAVVVLSGAVGVSASWLTAPIQPLLSFGFILETTLVGIGRCNNPLFRSNNTPPVIERDNPQRTAFGLHGFCESSRVIFDACIGPQTGLNDRPGYLDAAVDTVNPRRLRVLNASSIGEELSPIKALV